jgi:hypothetical protein
MLAVGHICWIANAGIYFARHRTLARPCGARQITRTANHARRKKKEKIEQIGAGR